ncbi:hypothetical protein CTI14_69185, partial [Methylobacterium radiotolerans]
MAMTIFRCASVSSSMRMDPDARSPVDAALGRLPGHHEALLTTQLRGDDDLQMRERLVLDED